MTAVIATVCLDDPADLPGVPGFIISTFSPLVNEVARVCLRSPGVGAVSGPHTALLLGTVFGDSTTSDTASRKLVAGDVHNPLLFYQSVPTTILGNVARDYGITGPMICLSTMSKPFAELRAMADLLFLGEDITQALLIEIELAGNPRTAHFCHQRSTDIVCAMFLRKESPSC